MLYDFQEIYEKRITLSRFRSSYPAKLSQKNAVYAPLKRSF